MFLSIFSLKLRIIPYLCEINVRTPTSFGPHKNLLNSNLVSKFVSTAAEWIVLSFDTPYYTELSPYSPQTVRLGYCFTPYQRLWLYNGAPLFAFYDTLGIRRAYSWLKPSASSRWTENWVNMCHRRGCSFPEMSSLSGCLTSHSMYFSLT